MGTHSHILARSSQVLAQSVGTHVTYNPTGGEPVRVCAVPASDELAGRPHDSRGTPARSVVLRIERRVVPSIKLKTDTISGVPAEWIGRTGDAVTLMVMKIADGRTGAGFWVLECAYGGVS